MRAKAKAKAKATSKASSKTKAQERRARELIDLIFESLDEMTPIERSKALDRLEKVLEDAERRRRGH